jgi:hypothetical protein
MTEQRLLRTGEDDVNAVDRPARTTGPPAPLAFDRSSVRVHRARKPYGRCMLVGLGGLFAGVTGPLLSNFVPALVRDALGEHRAAIGAVMAIDNVLLLLLVPWAGAASDRASASGRGRLRIVLFGFVLASAGMALFPSSGAWGIAGVVGALILCAFKSPPETPS